ncbi:hypothetical protein FRC12_003353 [Ceratobasidium sp. 428]|nr:hypothetical protein FRC12_003353 [Ceratobasidium sp. 428]
MHNVLADRVPSESIDLIAHSMGGRHGQRLISRIQVKEYDLDTPITISTPLPENGYMNQYAANIGIGGLGNALEEVSDMAGKQQVPPYSKDVRKPTVFTGSTRHSANL